MRHALKVYPDYFKALWCGDKTFEIRKNDRSPGYEERDEIVLQENEDGGDDGYTGREIEGLITYLTTYEQKPGYVVFSFRETHRSE